MKSPRQSFSRFNNPLEAFWLLRREYTQTKVKDLRFISSIPLAIRRFSLSSPRNFLFP